MKKNNLLKYENNIIRVLEIRSESDLIIDCLKRTMPKWTEIGSLQEYQYITEEELQREANISLPEV